ncbi:MAG: TIGR02221 family CRISPR-associated protein [Dethiobacteria bacterium]|jgi:CRISPR-associated DxTHG motif protein
MKKDMIGLSFIAPTDYKLACYYWGYGDSDFEYTTDLFPEVLPKLFPLTKLILFVTEEAARHKNCCRLEKKLGNLLKTVPIPLGKSEGELWDIFSIVAKQVPPEAALFVDITHAFRSLPLIVFNVASYLRRIKNVSVERIVYGNFEVRDSTFTPPKVPIFDLTSTVDLQDWLHGIDAFQCRGDAGELADSLSRTQDRLYQTRITGTKTTGLPQNLKYTAAQLQNFSEALRLLRPLDAASHAAKVHGLLEKVQEEASLWAKPFADILHDLEKDIDPLQNEDPYALNMKNLDAQLALINYYAERDLIVQTILLAREWLVSVLMLRTKRHKNWRNRNARNAVERELGLVSKSTVQKKANSLTCVKLPFWYQADPQSKEIAVIWSKLLQLRNDIAHCAMNTDAATPVTIRSNVKALIPSLEKLLT